MSKRTMWRISEVFQAIGLADRVWRCLNFAEWCEKHQLPPAVSKEWHDKALEAIDELKGMELGELVDAIIKLK